MSLSRSGNQQDSLKNAYNVSADSTWRRPIVQRDHGYAFRGALLVQPRSAGDRLVEIGNTSNQALSMNAVR